MNVSYNINSKQKDKKRANGNATPSEAKVGSGHWNNY
jgi:hypothetical protein